MPFENVTIKVRKDSTTPADIWRQDATAGSVMSFSLSDTRGVHTYAWRLKGRPEGSGAGGGGPEPISLGTAQTANITVDLRGTYIVECTVNAGAPNAETLRAGCAYLESITTPDGKALRLLGPGESSEDISDPLVRQGWIKMLNRWLKTISGGSVPTPFPHVRQIETAFDGTGTTTSGANVWWTAATIPALTTAADATVLVQAVVSGICAAKNVKVYARVTYDGSLMSTGEVTGSASYDGGPVDLSILAYTTIPSAGTHAYALEISSSTTDAFSEAYGSDHSQCARLVVTEYGMDEIPSGPAGPAGPPGPGSTDVADWDGVRYILLDGDAGNDSHAGYIDAAAGTDLTSRAADVAAAKVKTTHRVNEIRKTVGAGRMCVTLIKPRAGGAAYDHMTPGDGLGVDDRSLLSGYSLLHTRGSDLTNSLHDRMQLGYYTPAGVAGPGSTGEWTVGTVAFGAEGLTIQLVGATLPAAWLLPRYRLRALIGGTTTAYGSIRWGDLNGGADNLLANFGPIEAGLTTGDKIWLEYPGAKLKTYHEAASAVDGTSAPVLAAAGLAVVTSAFVGCADDPIDTRYSHVVVEAGGSLSSAGDTGSVSGDGTYTDEAGITGITNGPGIVAPSCNLVARRVRLSYCAIADRGTGDAINSSSINAAEVSIVISTLQTCDFYQGSLGVTIGSCLHGRITIFGNAHSEIVSMRGVPDWNPVISVAAANVDSSVNFQDLHNLFASVAGSEPSSPGIILHNGRYTALLDFLTDTANVDTIQAGNGVRVEFDDTSTAFALVTYASLKTTGFEVIGGQKIICKSTGVDNGFVGSVLPCPRGIVVKVHGGG
jgi:hypothetical protein